LERIRRAKQQKYGVVGLAFKGRADFSAKADQDRPSGNAGPKA
jgi:hypothetical protein